MSPYLRDLAERASRTFVQGYLTAWLIGGPNYDTLFTFSNLKYGVVALALSVAMSLGLKSVGTKNSPAIWGDAK